MKTGLSEQFRSSDLRVVVAIVALLLLALARPSLAQDIYVYPAKGQSQEQQDRDRYECHSWAVQQTGFDPSRDVAYTPAPQEPQSSVLKGATRGAVVGVVGG